MRRQARLLGVVLLAAAFPSGVVAAPACAEQLVRTLHIELEPLKRSYPIGGIVTFDVTVTRPADEDPLENGIPMPRPTSQPVEDVEVNVGGVIGPSNFQVMHGEGGETSQEGKVKIRMRIKPYTRPGPADLDIYAKREVVKANCVHPVEFGTKDLTNAFRAKRR